jgi:hypothetical protein
MPVPYPSFRFDKGREKLFQFQVCFLFFGKDFALSFLQDRPQPPYLSDFGIRGLFYQRLRRFHGGLRIACPGKKPRRVPETRVFIRILFKGGTNEADGSPDFLAAFPHLMNRIAAMGTAVFQFGNRPRDLFFDSPPDSGFDGFHRA